MISGRPTGHALRLVLVTAAIGAALASHGCGRQAASPPNATVPAAHEHHAPHGGTAVELGDEAYHLEFVLDAAEGRLQAFVLDGEMENFVRCPAPSFEVVATVAGERRPLIFSAVADNATGEKVGDTALFEAKADWLRSTEKFEGVLTSLTIKGTVFAGVPFRFPQGNEHDESKHAH